ncbi:MAG: hypothetical protein D6693_06270 [Planctomycetota bacterium]|nr:MAG: hypothetical protein D6693_06270 [Planctomycetota bacterium]
MTPPRDRLGAIAGAARPLIGMIHVGATPGSPRAARDPGALADAAADEARALADAGFDAAIVENMHDRPYVMDPGPEVVACMTRAALAARDAAPGLALGVQILSGDGIDALAVAHAASASFIRVENFAFAHVADEGLMTRARAGPLLRRRRAIGAESVAVFADVKKKHASHALTADLGLADACRAAEFFLADGLVITGVATGGPTDPADLAEARSASGLPILVGSGATASSLPALLEHADGVIVGSAIKEDGRWDRPVDHDRCRAMARAFRAAAAG